MNRYVKRGTSGIGLIDPTDQKAKIKYVFDVDDTGGKENSKKPYLWSMKEEYEQPILDMLTSKYEIEETDIYTVIDKIANKLAEDYYIDIKNDLSYAVEGSFLEDLDELNIKIEFTDALQTSISYTLMKKMNLDVSDQFDYEDFSAIFDFNTPATVSILADTVSKATEEVFREVAKTIIKEEWNG